MRGQLLFGPCDKSEKYFERKRVDVTPVFRRPDAPVVDVTPIAIQATCPDCAARRGAATARQRRWRQQPRCRWRLGTWLVALRYHARSRSGTHALRPCLNAATRGETGQVEAWRCDVEEADHRHRGLLGAPRATIPQRAPRAATSFT